MFIFPLLLVTIESESDRAFLSTLYEENYEAMYRKAKSMLYDDASAEDVIQDTFLYFAKNLDKIYKIPCNIRPFYIVMCIKRRCIDRLRTQKKLGEHIAGSMDAEEFSFDYPDDRPSVEEQALLHLDAETVQSTFSELPERLKDILRYKYLLEMSDREIAKTLGVSESSVRSYLLRARRAVLKMCEEKGYV